MFSDYQPRFRHAVVIFAFLLASCGNVARAQTLAQPQIVTNAPEVTITETPTPEYIATAQAAQQSEQAAITARLQAESDALHAQETAVASEVEIMRLTATMQADNNLAALKSQEIKATSDAYLIQATATGQRVAVEQSQANTILLEAQAENTRAMTEAKTAAVRNWLFGAMVAGLLMLGASMLWLAYKSEHAPVEEVEIIEQPKARIWKSENGGATLKDITPPGDPVTFLLFAKRVRGNPALTLAKDKWEGADSPYTRQTYAPVYAWLAANQFMNWQGGGLFLTTGGERFFDDYIENHPTPPVDKYAENSIPINQDADNQASETVGEVSA